MRALVAGWFSFEQMGATAGDLFARDVVQRWLAEVGCPYDVALARPFDGGVDWTCVDPGAYTHLVFVCGPFGRSREVLSFLDRFASCRLIGMNLSMLEPLSAWNPFDLLLERDSSRTARPDLSFLARGPRVPVAGIVLIDAQPEYRERNLLQSANDLLLDLARDRELAMVRIDTRLDINSAGLRTPAEIESLIARMDVVLTSRMHGLVLALKNGVPTVAVDPVAGGAKVLRQAQTIGWPCAFSLEQASAPELRRALDYCLTADARQMARACVDRARASLMSAKEEFGDAFQA